MTKISELIQLEKQKEFMRIGGQLTSSVEHIKKLYLNLIAEELGELSLALNDKFFTVQALSTKEFSPMVDELDALADILVVAAGFYAADDFLPLIFQEEDSSLQSQISDENKQLLLFDTLMSLQSMSSALDYDLLRVEFSYIEWEKSIPHMVLLVIMVMKIYELDIQKVMMEVYDSNFSKFTVNPNTGELEAIKNENGKIMKGQNFRLPNFKQFINTEG